MLILKSKQLSLLSLQLVPEFSGSDSSTNVSYVKLRELDVVPKSVPTPAKFPARHIGQKACKCYVTTPPTVHLLKCVLWVSKHTAFSST